ncbi:triose-phosphate isomerase [Candidatus Parvarchaeota archaeon]|nr:triose-phosphate isomerase [Candidatus Parvarchaeota archaeon]
MRELIINYKAYEEGVDGAISIAKTASDIAAKHRVRIMVSPPLSVLSQVSDKCESLAQRMDAIDPGAFTGHISWYEVKKAGGIGVLINHSENKVDYKTMKTLVELCKSHSLKSYVCCANMTEAKAVIRLNPTAIAYEPPSLIGGKISVSAAKPGIVKEFTDLVKNGSSSLALIGAGIKKGEDVSKSVELGSDGILVASGIMKSRDYKNAIEGLAVPLED